MKTIILVILVLLIAIFQAKGQTLGNLHGNVEQENQISNGMLTPQVKSYLSYDFTKKVGAYCWLQTSKGYSQIYCGPTFSPKGFIQVGVAMGAQTGKKTLRIGSFVWVGKGKFSNTFILETSGGNWCRNLTGYKASKTFTLTLVGERYKGFGPRLDVQIPKTKLSVGGEVFPSSRVARFGFRYSF